MMKSLYASLMAMVIFVGLADAADYNRNVAVRRGNVNVFRQQNYIRQPNYIRQVNVIREVPCYDDVVVVREQAYEIPEIVVVQRRYDFIRRQQFFRGYR